MVYAKYTLLVFALISACVSGCARHKPPGQLSIYREPSATTNLPSAAESGSATKKTAELTPFQETVVTLLSDSLDLLPNSTSSKIFDIIQKGIQIPDRHDAIDKNVLDSQKKDDVGIVAALIAQQIFGESLEKEKVIPQVILYFHKNSVSSTDLTAAASSLNSSENRSLDAYTISLNLLVNWIANNYALQQKPTEGLYIRDSKGDLYFHTKLKHVEM